MPATHINRALTKQQSCRLANERQELTRGGYSHVISTFSIFFVAPKSKIMSTAELGSNPEAQYDCAFPSTALVAECCALEDVADLSQLLHSPLPGAYSNGSHTPPSNPDHPHASLAPPPPLRTQTPNVAFTFPSSAFSPPHTPTNTGTRTNH